MFLNWGFLFVFVVGLVVYYVSSLRDYLAVLNRHYSDVVLVGGDGCRECEVAFAILSRCLEGFVYVKLSHEMDDELLEFFLDNNIYGIPILVYRFHHIQLQNPEDVCSIAMSLYRDSKKG